MYAKYHENKCEDWHHAKYQHFAFCWFTVLNILNECLIAAWSDFQQVIIDTTVDQWRKRLQACVRANVDILNTFCEQTFANNLHFHVFLVQVASIHRVSFLLCWCLMVDRPTVLNCKALRLLRTVNRQKAKFCYLHGANLCTYFNDSRHFFYLLDRW